jgi:hypothetical protein
VPGRREARNVDAHLGHDYLGDGIAHARDYSVRGAEAATAALG